MNPSMRNPLGPTLTKALCHVALVGFWLTLLVATHVPIQVPLTGEVDNVDKIYHFTAYAILAGLLATTWQMSSGILTARHLLWVWIAVVLYGAFDEWTQPLVNRECSIWDWVADAAGAATGLLIFIGLRRMFAGSR